MSYYTTRDQEDALGSASPNGVTFESRAEQYHIIYMVGNDQSDYQTMARIQEAGMGTGYKFRITSLESSAVATKGTIENKGVAPMYYDAYVAVDGVRSTMSLKGLQPGFFLEFAIAKGGSAPVGSIECDRLVPGQVIEFEADLEK